jgi:hypothetical protein
VATATTFKTSGVLHADLQPTYFCQKLGELYARNCNAQPKTSLSLSANCLPKFLLTSSAGPVPSTLQHCSTCSSASLVLLISATATLPSNYYTPKLVASQHPRSSYKLNSQPHNVPRPAANQQNHGGPIARVTATEVAEGTSMTHV